MKPVFLLLSLILSLNTLNAQSIKFKKNKVLIDGKEILLFKKIPFNDEYYFYNIKTTEEILYISYNNNNTSSYKDDDYSKIFFTKQNKKIESKSLWFGLNSKPIIEKLLQEGVLQPDGFIDENKLKIFVNKYNDTIIK